MPPASDAVPLGRSRAAPWWLLAVAAATCIGYLLVERSVLGGSSGFPLDDSWIHLAFARNLADGRVELYAMSDEPKGPPPAPPASAEPAAGPLESGRCHHCGYEMRGLPAPGVCPECGQAYDRTSVKRLQPWPGVFQICCRLGWPVAGLLGNQTRALCYDDFMSRPIADVIQPIGGVDATGAERAVWLLILRIACSRLMTPRSLT